MASTPKKESLKEQASPFVLISSTIIIVLFVLWGIISPSHLGATQSQHLIGSLKTSVGSI